MKTAYVEKAFGPASLRIIAVADAICAEYAAQGLSLTLRQIYYQFVARDIIPNSDREYTRLGRIISDARLAGLIDWDHMEDRTRNVRKLTTWESPAEILEDAARWFRVDKWNRQPSYVEVWIEKDALVGTIAGVCDQNQVPYFSCRGYTSQSEAHAAAQRLIDPLDQGKGVTILHLGDHDPSGIDMTRDIGDRLRLFLAHDLSYTDVDEGLDVRRIALTWEQITDQQPPPNPAKVTDPRGKGYVARYGLSSWELDALSPAFLASLVQGEIDLLRIPEFWDEDGEVEERERRRLRAVARTWEKAQDAPEDRL